MVVRREESILAQNQTKKT